MPHTVHEHFGPVPVVVAGSTGNLVEVVAVIVAAIHGITAVEVGIVFGTHVATASPAFVTHTEELHLPCLVTAVLPAELGHRRVAVTGHILNPLCQFFHSAASHVAADIWLATEHLAEVEELMCAEGVVFDGASPVVVLHLGALVLWSDAVHPVILVGKAASRPAQHRNLKGLQSLEHVLAVAVDVWYLGVFANPQSAVDAGTKVLSKLSIYLFMDFLGALGNVYCNLGVVSHCRH